MAFLPIGPSESQETMFEEPSVYVATEEYPTEEFAERDLEVAAEPFEPELKFVQQPASREAVYIETTPETSIETEPVDRPEPESHSGPGAGSAALTVDDFSALEERVVRAVSLVRRERMMRLASDERALKAEAQLEEQSWTLDRVTQLQQEVDALRAEREQVRQRVERLLSQLDALEL
jgi:hypothetical protein